MIRLALLKAPACSVATIAILTTLLPGCGRSGIGRLDLRGTVTHKGQPVPAGQVRFEPNASKGGSGPVGFAKIVDGEFDTREFGGRGPTPGPIRVVVTGYVSAEAFAPELFPRFKTEMDLVDGREPVAIEVE